MSPASEYEPEAPNHQQNPNLGFPPKAGIHMKAVFWLGIMFLMQIFRLRFKQSS